MCEPCLKHGEGKKWYLKAENYSDDLPSCRFVCRKDAIGLEERSEASVATNLW